MTCTDEVYNNLGFDVRLECDLMVVADRDSPEDVYLGEEDMSA